MEAAKPPTKAAIVAAAKKGTLTRLFEGLLRLCLILGVAFLFFGRYMGLEGCVSLAKPAAPAWRARGRSCQPAKPGLLGRPAATESSSSKQPAQRRRGRLQHTPPLCSRRPAGRDATFC